MKGFLATKKGKVILAVFIALIVVIVGILVGVGNKKDSDDTPGDKVNLETEKDTKEENDGVGLQVVDPEDEDVSDNSVDFSELTEDEEKDTDKDGTPDAKDDDDDNDGTPDAEDDDDDNNGTPDEEETNQPSDTDKENESNTNVSQDTDSWGPFF